MCGGAGAHLYFSTDLMFRASDQFEYLLCGRCGVSYQHPMPQPEQIAAFYPEHYSIYEKPPPARPLRLLERAVLKFRYGYAHIRSPEVFRYLAAVAGVFVCREDFPYVRGGKLLEIGCGSGRYLRRMKNLGWDCQGIDFSAAAVDICRSLGLPVHQGDLASMRFPPDTFDVVVASHLIEHLPDPGGFVEESARILKRGGILVLKTPNNRALGRKWFGRYWFADDVPRHLVHLSIENLDTLATRHQLRRVKTRLRTSPKYILNSIDYRLGVREKPSKKRRLPRLAAKIYVLLATLTGRGDEIFVIYRKS